MTAFEWTLFEMWNVANCKHRKQRNAQKHKNNRQKAHTPTYSSLYIVHHLSTQTIVEHNFLFFIIQEMQTWLPTEQLVNRLS